MIPERDEIVVQNLKRVVVWISQMNQSIQDSLPIVFG